MAIQSHFIKYYRDRWEDGFWRSGISHNTDYVDPAGNGATVAHDYIEHPRGYPTGTLEDGVAAFGAVWLVRGGSLGNRHIKADEQFSNELRDMFEIYRDGVEPQHQLKNRRCDYRQQIDRLDDLSELVTDNKELQRRLLAWFHYGIRKVNQRFDAPQIIYDCVQYAADYAIDRATETFTLHVTEDNATVYSIDGLVLHR